MYLAIDTCTETAGLALFDGQRAVEEVVWYAGRNHTAELMPALDALLRRRGLAPGDLAGLVVAKGPGSFNGIRVGMSAAKGLALTLQIPLVGVSTLEVHAYPFLWAGLPVWALLEMGRGQVAAALFQSREGSPLRLVEERLATPDEVCQRTDRPTLFCGNPAPGTEEILRATLGDKALFPPHPLPPRRPGDLAFLGFQRLQAGLADDPASLAPLYLRRPPVGE